VGAFEVNYKDNDYQTSYW